jgi:pimeloyl-ACP methyl ester carboxylesterase
VSTTRIDLPGADGLRLAADAVGDPKNPPCLLAHGGGQTRHSWHHTAEVLAQAGWYAVSMDLRGHGDSDWSPTGGYLLDDFCRNTISVTRYLGRPVLIGASLGGTSALAAMGATRTDPCGRALVLVDVAPHIEPAGADRILDFMSEHMTSGFASLDEVADAVHAYNPHRPRPSDLSGLHKNVRQREDGRWYWHWDPAFMSIRPTDDEARTRQHRTDVLEDAARSLQVPTLLVRGRRSDLLSENGAHEFLKMVPHARYVDVGGAGHMVAGDRNDAFGTAVVEFLAELNTADNHR